MEVKELKMNKKVIKKMNDNRNTIHSGMEPFVNMTQIGRASCRERV